MNDIKEAYEKELENHNSIRTKAIQKGDGTTAERERYYMKGYLTALLICNIINQKTYDHYMIFGNAPKYNKGE